ncbi:MAG: protein kinase [Patescibacteria group bacterium]
MDPTARMSPLMSAYADLVSSGDRPEALLDAAVSFIGLGMQPELGIVLRLARRRGDIHTVLAIRDYARRASCRELDVPDFDRWFMEYAVTRFGVALDTDAGIAFISGLDAEMIRTVVAGLGSEADVWRKILAAARRDAFLPPERLALLQKVMALEEAVVALTTRNRSDVDPAFRRYCRDNGIEVLKTLQSGVEGPDRRSNIYLVIDADGIAKVFKEVTARGGAPSEKDFFDLAGRHPSIPRCYGVIGIRPGLEFLKLSVCYGQTLADWLAPGAVVPRQSAAQVIAKIAEALAHLHERGIVHLDIRPENIVVDGVEATLLDLNNCLRAAAGETIDAGMTDPRYAPPEIALGERASHSSDVYQLGVLFHQLLTGSHPFAAGAGDWHAGRERQTLVYALPMALAAGGSKVPSGDPLLALAARMLDKDPSRRPSARQVVEALAAPAKIIRHAPRTMHRSRAGNVVLFPARMGIPHRGHVDYLCRLLELGYHAVISLQRAYTITDMDPLPKWLVMKMVAGSLMDRGFSGDDFDFIFTPFYRTRQEHRLHFAMMPGRQDVAAVASGNSEVHDLFKGLPILDQRVVFGHEGEDYFNRSWGALLRRAIKDGDRAAFDAYAASGVTRIMPFDELRRRYAENDIPFVHGNAYAALRDADGRTMAEGRVRRYRSPEESLMAFLDGGGKIIDPYARETTAEINGQRGRISYVDTFIDDQGNERISFVFHAD